MVFEKRHLYFCLKRNKHADRNVKSFTQPMFYHYAQTQHIYLKLEKCQHILGKAEKLGKCVELRE